MKDEITVLVVGFLLLPGIVVFVTLIVITLFVSLQRKIEKIWPNLLYLWLLWPWQLVVALPYIGPKVKDWVETTLGLSEEDEVTVHD